MELHEKTPPLSRDHLSSRNGYEKAIGPRELNFANWKFSSLDTAPKTPLGAYKSTEVFSLSKALLCGELSWISPTFHKPSS